METETLETKEVRETVVVTPGEPEPSIVTETVTTSVDVPIVEPTMGPEEIRQIVREEIALLTIPEPEPIPEPLAAEDVEEVLPPPPMEPKRRSFKK